MASTHDIERRGGQRTGGRGVVVEVDRTVSHRLAKRHSSRVRALRIALPLTAIVVAGGYALSLMRAADLAPDVPSIPIPDILPENLTMSNPHYEGTGKDGASYSIRADTAQQSLDNTSLITLNGISGLFIQADKKRTELKAAKGWYNTDQSVLELEERIDIVSESGLKARLSRATVEAAEGLVTSKEPVLVEFPGGTVASNALTLRQKEREVTFAEAVRARLQPAAGTPGKTQKPAAGAGFAATDAPVEIAAHRLDIKDGERIALFSGDVTAVQTDQALATPELEVHYEGGMTGSAPLAGASPAVPEPQVGDQGGAGGRDRSAPPAGSGSGSVSRIIARGPVVMTRGEVERVTCDEADFDAKASTAVLKGNVVMTSGADRRAVADRADIDGVKDTALLTGAVVVTSGKNELKGRQLWINRKTQLMQMTSPGGGRIAARFVQDGAKSKAAQTGVAASGGFATFKTNPDAPVEIEADQLEANDARKTAVFKGNVKAAQGEFVIRTAELVASYTGEAGMSDVAGTGAAQSGAAPKSATKLTRIEAKKKVVVTSADGQTVHGDWAVFDTAANTVTVGGDVMLSQGKNVVRGTRLVIEMATGAATIETEGQAAPVSAGDGWSAGTPSGPAGTPAQGRPSAVFYPDQLRNMRDGGQDKAKKAPDDAWKASTVPQSKP